MAGLINDSDEQRFFDHYESPNAQNGWAQKCWIAECSKGARETYIFLNDFTRPLKWYVTHNNSESTREKGYL